eukprot:gene10716-18863_t
MFLASSNVRKNTGAGTVRALEDSMQPKPSKKFRTSAAARGRQLQAAVRRMGKVTGKPVYPGRDRTLLSSGGIGRSRALRLLGLHENSGAEGLVGLEIRPVFAGGEETYRALHGLAEQFSTPARAREEMVERVDRGGRTTQRGAVRKKAVAQWKKESESQKSGYMNGTRLGDVYPAYDEEARKRRAARWWAQDHGPLPPGCEGGAVARERARKRKECEQAAGGSAQLSAAAKAYLRKSAAAKKGKTRDAPAAGGARAAKDEDDAKKTRPARRGRAASAGSKVAKAGGVGCGAPWAGGAGGPAKVIHTEVESRVRANSLK